MSPETAPAEILASLPEVSILLVDDNPANLLALEAVLEPLGHRLVRATNGDEALQHVLRESFALILMDAQMPGLDGFQTASLIKQREKTRDIPLIFVSAVYRETGHAERGYQVGASDYIIKPFEPEIMRAKVRAVITEHQRRLRFIEEARRSIAQERRALTEQSARQAAETANRLKDEFIAMISHELRTPLNAILGWGSMLQSGKVNPASLSKAYDAIVRNATLQKDLVEDLLDTSRIVSGKLRLNPRPTDVAALVAAQAEAVRGASEARGVAIVCELQPCQAVCDPERLGQVVSNLLGNAVKFSPSGQHVQVQLSANADDFEIAVSDHGIGIAADAVGRIFEPFWQADGKVPQRHEGLGLGLSIVRRIVEIHGGTIDCHSDGVGRGATFRVSLPRNAAEKEGPVQRPAASSAGGYPNLSGIDILFVDDEQPARDLVTTLVQVAGGRVVASANAAAAFDLLEQRRFDVLLSNLMLPGDDGFALITRIRAQAPRPLARIPAIAFSGEQQPNVRERAFAAGFNEFLTKPFTSVTLLSTIAGLGRG
jgi:signal transduction histidine kinase